MVKKIVGSVFDEEVDLVNEACKEVRQSRSQFVGLSAIEKAKKIIGEKDVHG